MLQPDEISLLDQVAHITMFSTALVVCHPDFRPDQSTRYYSVMIFLMKWKGIVVYSQQVVKYHTGARSLSPGGTGERIGVKVQELRGCDKDS